MPDASFSWTDCAILSTSSSTQSGTVKRYAENVG